MGRAGLSVAWLASCAPLVLPWLLDGPVERFAGVSALCLCALPWVVWLGAPRTAGGARSAPGSDVAGFALALPPIAAGAGLDLSQGAGAGRCAALAFAALGSALLLAVAARRAATAERAAAVYAVAWLALVALPPLARFALGLGGAPFLGTPPRFVAALSDASPVGWVAARAGDVHAEAGWPLGPLAVAAAVAALVEVARPKARPAP